MPKIVFNENFGVDEITIVLERRDFSKYGKLKDVTDIEYKDTMNAPELSFNVYKTDDPIWNKVNNYNLVYIPEYKEHFAISVNTTEENTTQKSVTCTYLPVSELQNVKLRNIQINTEDDIKRDDYDVDYPTIFCRDLSAYSKGSAMYKKLYNSSLLHRILDKAPNYKIGHVDASLMNLKSWFQYSISDSNIYDELTGEISDDYHCLFKFDSENRTISAYDLYNTCHNCGYRGDFHDNCPECESTNYGGAYGEDTAIYVSKENLSTSASIESSEDSLKNCFYITGGDDLMTSSVAIANPSGSNYIVNFSDEMYENMPEDLVSKIKSYNSNYQECMNKRSFAFSSTLVSQYNTIVKYVNDHYPKLDDNGNKVARYNTIFSPIIGYKNIAQLCFDCIDIGLILQTTMGKTIEMDNLTIQETMNLLTAKNLSPVAVKTPSQTASSVVANTILGSCKALINTALYRIDAVDYSYSQSTHIWKGKFQLTSIEDKTITLTGSEVSIAVNDDMEKYLKQNIQRCLNKLDTNYKDLKDLNTSDKDFQSELSYYSFDYLSGLKDSFGDVLGIILGSEINDLKNKYQTWYNNRISWLEKEMNTRQSQINIVNQLYNYTEKSGVVYDLQNSLQNELNLESYLGEDMWITFCSFRMEDTYQNDNYISDGLDNGELVTRATELIDAAKKELYKASHVQYTVSSTINNLLALPEFQPIVDKFEVGNWIHVCVDDKVYYLRLLSYKIFYSDISKIEVEFSTVERTWSGSNDVKSVIESAKAISSSFSYTAQKVKSNSNASKYVDNWLQNGMEATATKIVNNATNQNVVYDSSGILSRTYDDLTDSYDPCQSRQINSGLYVTDDGWKTVKAAIGKYIYTDPNTGSEITTMGVLADTVVGNFILGKNLQIINSGGNLAFNENGLVVSNGKNTFTVNPNDTNKLLKISNSTQDCLYTDVNGNLTMSGKIYVDSGKIGGFDIGNKYISNNATSLCENNNSIYVGIDGISCGKNIRLLSEGVLDAKYTRTIYEGEVITFHSKFSSEGISVYLENSSSGLFKIGTNINYDGVYIRPVENIVWHESMLTEQCLSFKYGDKGKSLFIGMLSASSNPAILYYGDEPIQMSKTNFDDTINFGAINSSYCITNSGDANFNKITALSKLGFTTSYQDNQIELYCKWADDNNHHIITRQTDGLSLLIGWTGSSDYKTVTEIRGQTVRYKNSSGTTTLSDERLKNSFKPLDEFDEVFMDLDPCAFKYNNGSSGRYHFGFKAQAVRDSFLKHGYTTQDFGGFVQMKDDPNNEDYCGYEDPMGLIYEEFQSWNIKMTQKAHIKINEQRQEIDMLRKELEELKDEIKRN